MDNDDYKFTIRSGDAGFTDRQKCLFDILNEAEKGLKKHQDQEVMECDIIEIPEEERRANLKRKRKETKQFSGRESLFKRPEALPPRLKLKCTKLPDYQKNPHKWTKYTLGDVSSSDMSNTTNTATALAFLKELRDRRPVAADGTQEHNETLPQFKPKFKPRREAKIDVNSAIVEKTCDSKNCKHPVFQGSKFVMPEYVVGQQKKRKSKKEEKGSSTSQEQSLKEITLGHLLDEDEENTE